ncbi:concanavalin A-like lectin/glucanase domain-containing protein [Coprinopsis sp. MPI-PUGE-AT-0042]|nr:concanavalin A-like lectin/glucanase domain-containing protein [Coprinopsis sp. MPI-PUGE-AT-0042]
MAAASAQRLEGKQECASVGGFDLCQNVNAATGGTQASTASRSSRVSVSWSTEYDWAAKNVNTAKSFANVESHDAKGLPLSRLPTLAVAWAWKYASRSENLKATVGFDIWIGSGEARAGNAEYEVQVWLSKKGGAVPLGKKSTIAECIVGYDWQVWRGKRGSTEVITFTNLENEDILSFTGDMGELFDYLMIEGEVPEEYFIQSIQAGTQVFNGKGNMQTSLYTLWVEYPV